MRRQVPPHNSTARILVLHDVSGAPLGGMTVFIASLYNDGPVRFGKTNADGILTFTDLPEGAYLAIVSANNHQASALFHTGQDAYFSAIIRFNPDIDGPLTDQGDSR